MTPAEKARYATEYLEKKKAQDWLAVHGAPKPEDVYLESVFDRYEVPFLSPPPAGRPADLTPPRAPRNARTACVAARALQLRGRICHIETDIV